MRIRKCTPTNKATTITECATDIDAYINDITVWTVSVEETVDFSKR